MQRPHLWPTPTFQPLHLNSTHCQRLSVANEHASQRERERECDERGKPRGNVQKFAGHLSRPFGPSAACGSLRVLGERYPLRMGNKLKAQSCCSSCSSEWPIPTYVSVVVLLVLCDCEDSTHTLTHTRTHTQAHAKRT